MYFRAGAGHRFQNGDGTSDWMKIDTSGNVGIGTTEPAEKLEISSGNIKLDQNQYIKFGSVNTLTTSSSGNTTLTSGPSGAGQGALTIAGNNDIRIAVSTSNNLILKTNGGNIRFTDNAESDLVRITSAGNVGIGTTDPGAKLEVNGQVKITGGSPGSNKVLTSDGDGLATWKSISGSGGVTGTGSAGQATFWTDSSIVSGDDAFWWDNSNKRLGIGTTNPGAKLDVNGNVYIRGTTRIYSGAQDGEVYGTAYTSLNLKAINERSIKFITGPTGSYVTRLTIGGTGNVTINEDLTVSGGDITLVDGGTIGIGGAKWTFDDSNDDITTTGNVGIGTASPSNLLQLGTPGTTAGTLSFAGGTSGLVTMDVAATAGTWTFTLPTDDGDTNEVLTTDGSGNTSWVAVSSLPAGNADTLDSLDSTDFLRATASDTFEGINSRTLTIQSSLSSANRTTDLLTISQANNATYNFTTGNLVNISQLDTASSADTLEITQAGTGMAFRVNDEVSDTTPFVINNNGNVGIGTTAPGYKLDVSGNTRIDGDLTISGGDITGKNGEWIDIGESQADSVQISNNLILGANKTIDDDTSIGGNSDDWIRLNGYIEMKSNTDSYGIVLRDKDNNEYFGLTQKDGASYLADTAAYSSYFLKGDGANVTIRGDLTVSGGRVTGSNSEYISIGETNNAIAFVSGGSEKMRIHTNGYVGIGTTSPGATLDVDGDLLLGSGTNVNNIKTTVGATGDDNSLVTEQGIREALDDLSTGGGVWTDGGTYIYPTDAGNYGGSGLQITDAGNLSMDGNLVVDGTITSGLINGQTISSATHFTGTVTITSTLAANNGITIDGNTVIDNGGGWHRSYGATGWYNGTYGGGWYMSDSTWIRNYNSKPLYINGNNTTSATFMSGKVGIGTTAPNGKLQVVGDEVRIGDAGTIGYATADGDLYVEDQLEVDGYSYLYYAYFGGGTSYYINNSGQALLNTNETINGIDINAGTISDVADISLNSAGQIDFYDEVGDKTYWYSNIYGTGIESSTLTNWSSSQFRWRIGGTSVSGGTEELLMNSTTLRPGANGGLNLGDATYRYGTLYVNQICLDGSSDCVTSNIIDGTGSQNYIAKWSDSDTLTYSSLIYDDGTNIGIGTTSPNAKLNVVGNTSTLLAYDSTTGDGIQTFGKNPLMQLTGDGTTNKGPGLALLQLNIGGADINQSASELYIGATRGTTAGTRAAVGNTDILGQIGFFGDDGTNLRTRGALIQSFVDTSNEAVGTGIIPARLALITTEKAPITFHTDVGAKAGGINVITTNERMRIDYNGNVGIGTTNPGAQLQVGTGTAKISLGSGDIYAASDIEVDGTLYLGGNTIANSEGQAAITLTSNPQGLNQHNSLSYGSWLIDNTVVGGNPGMAALMVNQANSGDIFTASASGLPKVVIDNSGNVGIGTATPAYALDISSSGDGRGIRFDSGHAFITTHDGYGNFNLLSGIDDDNVIQAVAGGTRIELSESGVADIEIYSGDVGTTGTEVASFNFSDAELDISSADLDVHGEIKGITKLSFDQGTNFRIDTNSSGLLFDGGDGNWDFLIYDNQIYSDTLRLGYSGDAKIITESGLPWSSRLTSSGKILYVSSAMSPKVLSVESLGVKETGLRL